MFGLFKKPIPGPDNQRRALIEQIIRHRLGDDDPICAELPDIPFPHLKLTAEAAILFIVEQFLTLFITNVADATEQNIVKILNEMHAGGLSMGGQDLPLLNRPATLFEYVRHYLDTQFSATGPYTDAFVSDAIRMIKKHYGR